MASRSIVPEEERQRTPAIQKQIQTEEELQEHSDENLGTGNQLLPGF
jgi:hypothetical protein